MPPRPPIPASDRLWLCPPIVQAPGVTLPEGQPLDRRALSSSDGGPTAHAAGWCGGRRANCQAVGCGHHSSLTAHGRATHHGIITAARGGTMKRVVTMCGTTVLGAALALGLGMAASSAQTLKKVQDRGSLMCGVSQGLPGFSNPDDKGNWTGFDVDECRAVAAVIFDDPTKVKFVPLSAKDRFTALQSGVIDVLSRNTTWTLSRDTSLGANFTGVTYYDGQGFLVKKSLKVN